MLWDHQDPEECRVWMVVTGLDLKDRKVQREMLVFLVTLVYRATTVRRDRKDIQDPRGTGVVGGTQACQENQVSLELTDIQDTKARKVLLGAEACLNAN